MALGFAQFDAVQSSTDGTSFLGTTSLTPTAGRLILVGLEWSKASTPDLPSSVAGYGLTFTRITDTLFNTSGTPTKRCAVYYAYSGLSPTNARLTITFGATQTGCCIVVDQVSGHLEGFKYENGNFASGTGNSVAVGGTVTATLAALHPDGRNGVYIIGGTNTNNAAIDPESGWQQNRDQGVGTPAQGIYVGYSGTTTSNLGTTDNTATVTVATATKDVGIAAFEIQAARSLPLRFARGWPAAPSRLWRGWWQQ